MHPSFCLWVAEFGSSWKQPWEGVCSGYYMKYKAMHTSKKNQGKMPQAGKSGAGPKVQVRSTSEARRPHLYQQECTGQKILSLHRRKFRETCHFWVLPYHWEKSGKVSISEFCLLCTVKKIQEKMPFRSFALPLRKVRESWRWYRYFKDTIRKEVKYLDTYRYLNRSAKFNHHVSPVINYLDTFKNTITYVHSYITEFSHLNEPLALMKSFSFLLD